jgi:hypothetical protein
MLKRNQLAWAGRYPAIPARSQEERPESEGLKTFQRFRRQTLDWELCKNMQTPVAIEPLE